MKSFLGFIVIANFLTLHLTKAQLLPKRQNNLWGAINLKGELVLPYEYQSMTDFNAKGYLLARKNGFVGVFRQDGKAVITPDTYEKIQILTPEYFAVCQQDRCGLIDSTGKVLIALQYDALEILTPSLVKTYRNDRFGVVSTDGKEILSNEYDRIDRFENAPITYFFKNSKQGILQKNGTVLAEAIYEKFSFENPINTEKGILQPIRGDKLKGITIFYLDSSGNLVSKQEFNNETHLIQTRKAELAKAHSKILQTVPDAKKPRWIQEGFDYKLTDAIGRNLLDTLTFWDVVFDSTSQLYAAKRVRTEKKDAKVSLRIDECYVIDTSGKILFKADAKEIVLEDFATSQYARLTLDTLYDALIDKKGNIIKEINIGGKAVKIQNVGNFSYRLAWVQLANRYGYINTSAQLVIPAEYELASDFANGYASAKKNGNFGLLDTKGNAVIPFEWQGIDVPTADGALRIKKGKGAEGKWALYSVKNQPLTAFVYSMIYPFEGKEARCIKEGKWGVLDTKGKEIVPTVIQADYLWKFEGNIARIANEKYIVEENGIKQEKFRKYGYVNRQGSEIIPPVYEDIIGFEKVYSTKQGLARIIQNGKVGFLDYEGKIILTPSYTNVTNFEEVWTKHRGIARVYEGKRLGYIDRNGKVVVPIVYDEIQGFEKIYSDSTGFAIVMQNGKYGYITHRGKIQVPCQYEYLSEIREGKMIARQNGKYGVIDTAQKIIIPFLYDGMRFTSITENWIEVFVNQPKTFYVDAQGNFLTQQPDTLQIETALKIFQKDKLYGLQNATGKVVVKPIYAQIEPFSEGLAVVKLVEKNIAQYGYLSETGALIIAPQFAAARSFSDGKAAVNLKGKWGYIDKTGKWVIAPQYLSAGDFSDGYAIVNDSLIINAKGEKVGQFAITAKAKSVFKKGRVAVQTLTGECHLKTNGIPAYFVKHDEVTDFQGNIAFAKRGEMWELIRDVNGRTVRLPFTKSKKQLYEEEYGPRRKIKDEKDGEIIKDIGWELVRKGNWKMIDADGNPLSDIVFEDVKSLKNCFQAVVSRLYGLLDIEGNVIVPAEYEMIRAIENTHFFRLEKDGNTSYLSFWGFWIK
ncbi:MAG: WG repeat-containing protein [Cytophagales bacterium]|nr:WG repeat-containing protein [Cytophagales bacterium]MDW8384440.1 WG repeat-containing protein [Flammeovirgaceae bacterium]